MNLKTIILTTASILILWPYFSFAADLLPLQRASPPAMVVKQFEWIPAVVQTGEQTAFHWNVENAKYCIGNNKSRTPSGNNGKHVYTEPREHITQWYCNDALGNRLPADETKYLEAPLTVKAPPCIGISCEPEISGNFIGQYRLVMRNSKKRIALEGTKYEAWQWDFDQQTVTITNGTVRTKSWPYPSYKYAVPTRIPYVYNGDGTYTINHNFQLMDWSSSNPEATVSSTFRVLRSGSLCTIDIIDVEADGKTDGIMGTASNLNIWFAQKAQLDWQGGPWGFNCKPKIKVNLSTGTPVAYKTGLSNTVTWKSVTGAIKYQLDIKYNTNDWTSVRRPGNYFYTTNSASWDNLPTGSRSYRVRACFDSTCNENFSPVSNTIVTSIDAVTSFTTSHKYIRAGQRTHLYWNRPSDIGAASTLHYNLYVEKPDGSARYRFQEMQSNLSFYRTINMVGIHKFFVEACRAKNDCGPEKSVTVNVVDYNNIAPVASFSATNTQIGVGKVVDLHWTDPKGSENIPFRYNVYIEKPDGSARYRTLEGSWSQGVKWILNMSGRYKFFVEACIEKVYCGHKKSLIVNVKANSMYQVGSDFYLQLPSSHKGKYIKLRKITDKWLVEVITPAKWNAMINTKPPSSDYSIAFGEFSGDSLLDFKLAFNGENIVIEQHGKGYKVVAKVRKIIFIHTDLLGSPVAETDTNGDVQ
ncbi:MAG: hypothetical protein GY928_31115 [Colwellia sp.]|nr:hypothetical protein [Colwellia sp.]